MRWIGEDVAETLDRVPARLRVLRTIRLKYACRACEGPIVQAKAPARLVEGGDGLRRDAALAYEKLLLEFPDHIPGGRNARGGGSTRTKEPHQTARSHGDPAGEAIGGDGRIGFVTHRASQTCHQAANSDGRIR